MIFDYFFYSSVFIFSNVLSEFFSSLGFNSFDYMFFLVIFTNSSLGLGLNYFVDDEDILGVEVYRISRVNSFIKIMLEGRL